MTAQQKQTVLKLDNIRENIQVVNGECDILGYSVMGKLIFEKHVADLETFSVPDYFTEVTVRFQTKPTPKHLLPLDLRELTVLHDNQFHLLKVETRTQYFLDEEDRKSVPEKCFQGQHVPPFCRHKRSFGFPDFFADDSVCHLCKSFDESKPRAKQEYVYCHYLL